MRPTLFLCVTALVSVATATVPSALNRPTVPDVATAVRALITPTRLEQHARRIVEHERLSGSAGENAAIDYIIATLRADGIPVTVDTMMAYTSDPIMARVELIGSSGEAVAAPKSITVAFSSTVTGLEAPIVDMGDVRLLPEVLPGTGERLALAEDGAAVVGEVEPTPGTGAAVAATMPTISADTRRTMVKGLRGAIALVTGTPGPEDAWKLQQLGAVGAVFVNPAERLNDLIATTVWGTPSLRDSHRIPDIAVAEVAKSGGDELRRRIAESRARDPARPVRFRLTTETRQGWKPLRLVVARVPAGANASSAAPYVLLGGHIDAWYHGATDEGASNAAMLELVRAFHQQRAHLQRGLVVAWWPGHSNGRYAGSAWFADRHFVELRDRALAYLNVDGIGQMGAKVYTAAASASLGGLASAVVRERTGIARLTVSRPGRDSDQSFNGIGIPLLQLNHNRLAEDGGYWWWHTPHDTFDKIDFGILKSDTDLYVDALAQLLISPVPPIDVAAEVEALGVLLLQRRDAASGRLPLTPALERHARMLTAARDIQTRLTHVTTSAGVAPEGIDIALVRMLRPIHRVVYTLGGAYHPDPAMGFGPLPGLAEARSLATLRPGSDASGFTEATLIREQNRIVDALDQSLTEATRLQSQLTDARPVVTYSTQQVGWPTPSGDPGAMRWSPLADVNRANVSQLEVAWTWRTGERAVPAGPNQKPVRPGQFQASPVVIGDTMYVSTPYAAVAAIDARTGAPLWTYDPEVWRGGQPSNGTGMVHRGVATWSKGKERRVFINARWKLVALDARTGKPIPSFGNGGEINLTRQLRRPVDTLHYTNTSPPVVYGDVVIVGNGVGDRLRYRNDPPGDVQAFDVRTGRRVWSFKTIPDSGEYGWKTWEDGSYKYMGHTNVWAPMSLDAKRGLLFLPVSTPTNDWYGGDRKGDNLFAESVVALDARTGRRVWHYQIVHHGLWDYDLPSPPVLATMRWKGRPRDVVVVPSKTAWMYVFDRVTGVPIWPIIERPVPASDVPGERASPTQPMPSRPAPFTRQTVTENDLIDFTPELRRRALEVFRKYRSGPIFTPPSLQGTIVMPGSIGGAGWGSTAFDPDTRTLYVKGTDNPVLYRIRKGVPNDTIGYDYTVDLIGSGLGVTADPDSAAGNDHTPPTTLPLIKPPYGTMTAIDLDNGTQKWQVTFGDTPAIREHPLLKGTTLPPLGVAGAVGGTVTRGGVIFATGGGNVLYALDTRDGRVLWQRTLSAGRGYANPITYRTADGRQFVVIASGGGDNAELVAFSIDGRR